MAYLRAIQVNGQSFELPPAELPNNLMNLSEEMAVVGVSASELVHAIYQLRDAFAQLNYIMDKGREIQDNLNDLRYQCDNRDDALSCRVAALECELSELRPVLNEMIETPKQKSDLEIFNWITPSVDFLKLEGNIFLD